MTVEFLKSFSKDLDKISSSTAKTQFKKTIIVLEKAVNLKDVPSNQKLKGHQNAFRI